MSSRQYLIADPDEGQRQLLDLLLSDGNSVLVAVGTARQALEYLRSNTPSLVVLAQELPDMPGTAVCKRLKAVQRLANVPVIVTTDPPEGLGVSVDVRREAGEAGVDLLLPKPLGDKALKERARRLMQETEAAAKSPRRASTSRQHGSTAVIDDTLKELDRTAPAAPSFGTGTASTGSGTAGSRSAGSRSAGSASTGAGGANADDRVLTQEVDRVRDENVMLRRKLLAAQETVEKLRAELDDLKRRRGLFGRRK